MIGSEILNIQEHCRCENYDSDGKTARVVIENANFKMVVSPCAFIMYILSGTVVLSYGTVNDYLLSEGDFMLFPPGTQVAGTVKRPVKYLLLKVDGYISLCCRYSLEKLYNPQTQEIGHTHLRSNGMVRMCVDGLVGNIENGVRCVRFIENKTQELFYYLRFYYPEDDLAGFYKPMLGTDAKFVNTIWKHYRNEYNVIKLARITNMSLSTFRKEFKRIIGQCPSEWIVQQKIWNVHFDICRGEKSLKEIAEEYHFSSPSHLGTFCRKHFDKTPAELKQEKKDMPEN